MFYLISIINNDGNIKVRKCFQFLTLRQYFDNMTKEEYKNQFTNEDPVGWISINKALEKLYGEPEPRHYPPLCGSHFMAGGTNPIDGASIYDSKKQQFHRHIISYGMSELYFDEEKAGADFSKWGFEFTMRLAPFEGDQKDPLWAVSIMNNLARYVFSSGNWFEENHFVLKTFQ